MHVVGGILNPRSANYSSTGPSRLPSTDQQWLVLSTDRRRNAKPRANPTGLTAFRQQLRPRQPSSPSFGGTGRHLRCGSTSRLAAGPRAQGWEKVYNFIDGEMETQGNLPIRENCLTDGNRCHVSSVPGQTFLCPACRSLSVSLGLTEPQVGYGHVPGCKSPCANSSYRAENCKLE